MAREGMVVEKVRPGGIASRLGIEPGDRILRINGQPVRDIIDYRFWRGDEKLNILLAKPDGKSWLLDIEKDCEDRLGLDFGSGALGEIRRCQNQCIFCFLAQLPGGLRHTLYIPDDDYRLSFLEGNFITLTNLGRKDFERIAALRLSPLYISVHTTNPSLREKMLGHSRAGKIMKHLRFLAGAGIKTHAQAVLCPGLNDGAELARTISDLCSLAPGVQSLAVVPVGLTRFRDGLFPLEAYDAKGAREVLALVKKWQRFALRKTGSPFVFAGDEFYFLAGEPVPGARHYAGFPQLENGVGLVRSFLSAWAKVAGKLPRRLKNGRKATIATGRLGEQVLKPVVERLNRIEGLQVQLVGVENQFFGEKVTVAGLVTAKDLIVALSGKNLGEALVIPSVMLRAQGDLFLDGLSVDELAGRLGLPVIRAKGPGELCRFLVSDRAVA